jgi:osmoprotectant transport system permease protein
VSVGVGAWLAFVGIAILWFQGARGMRTQARSRRLSRLAVPLAALAAVVVLVAAVAWGGLGGLSLALEYRAQSDLFWTLVGNHVYLSLAGTAIAVVLGVPLGVLAARRRAVRAVAIPAAGVVQTVPSLALFGLLMTPLAAAGLPSIGPLPVLIALTLYAFLPIVRDTYLGISSVDPAIVDAGRGMGMSRAELLLRVEFPLALPLVLEGVRVALVLTVGIAAVMAIGGAQDLGTLVFLGWGSQAADLTLLGALPMVALAIVFDRVMRVLEHAVVSRGIAPVRLATAAEEAA